MAKAEKESETEAGDTASNKSSTVKIVIIAVVAALLIGGGLVGGTFYFVSNMNAANTVDTEQTDGEDADKEAEPEPKAPANYHAIDPKFVVSFRDQRSARFMQFEIEIMSRNKDAIKLIGQHNPAIRSSLLMLFDNQNYEKMTSKEGKQLLLNDIVKDINDNLVKITGKNDLAAAVEACYFTSFVIQ